MSELRDQLDYYDSVRPINYEPSKPGLTQNILALLATIGFIAVILLTIAVLFYTIFHMRHIP